MSVSTVTAVAKSQLRKQMRAVLPAMTEEDKAAQSKSVACDFLQSAAYRSARTVAIYLSLREEVDTSSIIEDIFRSGRACYIPRYFPESNRMDMVRLRDEADLSSLPKTKWNVRQPAEDDQRGDALEARLRLDVVVVPGMAFSADGKRLGRGKGYYDTFLARCKDMDLLGSTAALAFRQQIVQQIPTDQRDFLIEKVFFQDGIS